MSGKNRITRMGLAAMALLVVSTASSSGELDPFPFEARFEMRARGFVIATIDWSLRPGERGFVFESRSQAAGMAALFADNSITERSEWLSQEGVFRPVRYRYERTGKKKRKTAIDFDWTRGLASATSKGQSVNYEVPADAMDKLSYVLAVMRDMRKQLVSMHFPVATARELRDYRFEAGPAQKLETALGVMDAIPVKRDRDEDSRETVIWLAPSLEFIPVRIDHRESDGEVLAILLLELKR